MIGSDWLVNNFECDVCGWVAVQGLCDQDVVDVAFANGSFVFCRVREISRAVDLVQVD